MEPGSGAGAFGFGHTGPAFVRVPGLAAAVPAGFVAGFFVALVAGVATAAFAGGAGSRFGGCAPRGVDAVRKAGSRSSERIRRSGIDARKGTEVVSKLGGL